MSTEIVSKHVMKVPERLVAPIEKINVPNHLLNSRIFAKLERNDLFEVSPVEIHFSGYEIDSKEPNKYTQILRVINISDQVQRMTVLPPQTKYFDVFYVKPDRLVPGFSLDIQVIFKPDEYRYYSDAIRIHSKGEENLIIPIHAYPIVTSFDFPTEYKFPNIAIGESLTRSFSIRSTAPVEFEFMIDILQKHPAFEIDPLEGVIPYNSDVLINIKFCPKEFCTAIMILQLIVSQFNAKPIVCKFYGNCNPGISRDRALKMVTRSAGNEASQTIESSNSAVDPRMLSPLYLSRMKRFTNNSQLDKLKQRSETTIEIDGYRFPKEIRSVWEVSKFLNQTKGKLRLKDLRAEAKLNQTVSKQQKETLFLQKVIELEDEERRNQLKWQVKLGETSIDPQSKEEILISRAQAEYQYKLALGQPVFDDELTRKENLSKTGRTTRPYNQLGRTDIRFDSFKNELWSLRHRSAVKFIQAARRIIIVNRLVIRLNGLKTFANEWLYAQNEPRTDGILTIEGFIELYEKKLKGENIEQDIAVTSLTSKTLGTFYFPQKVDSEDSQSASNLDSLGLVAVKPIEFSIETETPYINLGVPKNYILNNYKYVSDSQYVPKFESRIQKLRKGAEDELIQVDIKANKKPVAIVEEKLNKDSNEESTLGSEKTIVGPKIIDLEVPSYLTEPIEYPPLHIFNPAPGLISYQKMLPYAGCELNYHLNPLPRFEKDHAFTAQKKFVDRDDVVKGIMTWKKFPSQGLISLSNTPTLTDVWVPRWSNVFGSDLMPVETPPLLAGLPVDDKENLFNDHDDSSSEVNKESIVRLTPEMVNAQFDIPNIFISRDKYLKEEIQFPYSDKLPPTNLPASLDGPVPREQREQELEYFLNKQYNDLGLRIKNKINLIQNGNETTVMDQQSNVGQDEQLESQPQSAATSHPPLSATILPPVPEIN